MQVGKSQEIMMKCSNSGLQVKKGLTGMQWLAEKIALFQRRCEEGYDLPDEEYIQWLHETHPDAENTSGNDNVSLADSFPDVPIATPVGMVSELPVEKMPFSNGDMKRAMTCMMKQWLHEIHPDADNTSGNDFVSLVDCFPDVPIATPVTVVPESLAEISAETENHEISPKKATPFEAEDGEMFADRGALPNNNQQSEEKSVEVGCDTAPL